MKTKEADDQQNNGVDEDAEGNEDTEVTEETEETEENGNQLTLLCQN